MEPLASYPVFQADQVLTNGHLNNLFNYLEQQERLSRMKLVGSGIICGLEIMPEEDRIRIGEGVGLTSQGYLVSHCDKVYTHYAPYVFPDSADDLYLVGVCGADEGAMPAFYREKGVLELLAEGTDRPGKKQLATVNRSDHAIVLFLEVVQTDLKNCDTNDCNDKGSRIDFVTKALLVPKKFFPQTKQKGYNSILLERYNVPAQELGTADAVLAAFQRIVDDDTLKKLSFNLANCWDRHAVMLGLSGANPLKNVDLARLRGQFSVANNNLHHIQYFYDFVDDLLKAFIEFRSAVRKVQEVCCADEWISPLHLSIGDAGSTTALGSTDPYRHNFQPAPILADGKQRAAACLQRICHMVRGFRPDLISKRREIVITPTNLGKESLAYRCVPYYYAHKDLLPYWNFGRLLSGNFNYNMGYHASVEAEFSDAVANPLLYDIERYDAFRIEGHIGMRYEEALREIQKQQHTYNLPIDVLALDTASLDDVVQGREIHCIIQDLESSYAVLIAGMLCKIRDIINYVATLRPRTVRQPVATPAVLGNKEGKVVSSFSQALVLLQAEHGKTTFTHQALLAGELPALKKKLAANEKTGLAYLDKMFALKEAGSQEEEPSLFQIVNAGYKNNIIDATRLNLDKFQVYLSRPEYLVNFLNDLDAILKYLVDASLPEFDEESYTALWEKYVNNVKLITREVAETGEENAEMKAYFAAGNYDTLLFRCTNEELIALKTEYQKRLIRYATAVNFSRYYQQHSGLEHKAGVPKGGTFVLVYQSQPATAPLKRNPLVELLEVTRGKAVFAAEKKQVEESVANKASMEEILAGSLGDAYAEPPQTKGGVEAEEIRSLRDTLKKMGLTGESYTVIDKTLESREKELEAKRSALPYDVVIADFYLPYQCNSACPPIAYVFQDPVEPEKPEEPTEPEPAPTISVEPTRFCSTDSAKYLVRIAPEGGKLTIGGIGFEKPEFVPSRIGAGTHKLEYTVGTRVASASVTVAALENVAVGVAAVGFKDETWAVKFAPTPLPTGARYTWMLNDEKVSADETPTLDFNLKTYLGDNYLAAPTGRRARKDGSAALSLVVSNDPCPDVEATVKISLGVVAHQIVRGQGKQEIPFEAGAKDTKFVALPDGVEFTGKSLVVTPDVLFKGVTTLNIKYSDRIVAGYVATASELTLFVLILQPAR